MATDRAPDLAMTVARLQVEWQMRQSEGYTTGVVLVSEALALIDAYVVQAARLAAAAAVLERFAGTRVPTAADFDAAADWLEVDR